MKSERRHELKANSLVQGIGGLPLFWRLHGTKVMLLVVAALATVLFVKFQIRNAEQRRETAGEAYSSALGSIATLQRVAMISDPRLAAEQKREIQTAANAAIDQVLENAKDDAAKAEAMYARGELNWALAQLPELAGSATQPSQKSELSKDELLDKAKQAYDAAIQTSGAKALTVTSSRLGLANIAEQRRQWDAAREQYQKLMSDPNTAQPFKDHAGLRLDDLKRLVNPPLFGKPATAPATEAAGPAGPPAPATSQATSGPTTAPATTPATRTAKPQAATKAAPADVEKPDAAPPAPAPAPSPTPAPKP